MRSIERGALAQLALIGIAAVWGLTFVMVQDALAVIPVLTFLAYRFLTAAALVGVIFRRELKRLSRDGRRAGIAMGTFLMVGYVFQTFGLERTTASNTGFITGLFVVLTPIFGAVILGQRAGVVAWTAALISAAGLFLLSGTGGKLHLAGDGLVLVTACSFAFHILATDRAVAKHDVGALLAVQLAVCGVVPFVVAALVGDLEIPSSATVWSALAVTSIVASALGFFVQTYAQRHAPPARTALILASEPAFAGLFAYLLKDESLSLLGWLGALLILASIAAVEAVPYLRPARPLPEG
ncbi:MAG: DMT family transporter [Actinobacteria bacterium]|nr:DMT family transporter [Actinomycetota bacterium]